MKSFVLFLLLLKGTFCGAQDPDSTYQLRKEIFSNLMGFEIDTMIHPLLYHEVADWLYTSYSYGGKGRNGIDCSDFSAKVYEKAFGISLRGSSADIHRIAEPVEKEQLREGDLVFFKINRGKISHVGIYLTKNKFAHATVKAGVIISDLNEPYYRKYYFGAGRIREQSNRE